MFFVINFDAGFFCLPFFIFLKFPKLWEFWILQKKKDFYVVMFSIVTFSLLFLFLITLYFPIVLTKVHPCFTVTVALSTRLCLIKSPLREVYHIANSVCISSLLARTHLYCRIFANATFLYGNKAMQHSGQVLPLVDICISLLITSNVDHLAF